MRTLAVVVSLLLALVATAHSAHAADASVHAILITASTEKADSDPRLAPYEATLQRNLPESSFRFVSEGNATVAKGRPSTISLASGHHVELEGGDRAADGIQIRVRWLNGKTTVMTNSFTFQPGIPIVLGRRSSGNGAVPIVILIAK